MTNGNDRARVQSVARAAEILRCFEAAPELGITELSDRLGLSKSTVFGLVDTLAAYGLLEQTESKKYRLGVSLFELGNLVISRLDLRDEARRVCAPLAQKYPAAIHMAVHSDGEVVYVDKLNRENTLISASNVGRRAPMHCTGVGKAMLAFLPESYLNTYLHFPLRRFTERTITTREALLAELAAIRKSGVAEDREEIEPGVHCIAAPILQHDGRPQMAISLSFPQGRAEQVDLVQAKRDLLVCTHALSARLGFKF